MIKHVFILSRPRFWIYVLGPYVIGYIASNDIHTIPPVLFWYGLFYFLLPANVLIYSVNDYFDRNIDRENPKKHKQERYMRKDDKPMYLIILIISLLLAIPLFFSNTVASTALVIFILFGIGYSSPPFRFKTKPILDSLSNFFYILPGVISYAMVTGNVPPLDILIAVSLWSIAMHLFSAIVDITADKKAGITTTATVFGSTYSLLLTSSLWLASVMLVIPYSQFLLIGLVYPILPLYVLVNKYSLERMYWLFPYINTICGFLLFCILIFNE